MGTCIPLTVIEIEHIKVLHIQNLVLRSSSLAGLELLKEPRAGLNVSSFQAFCEIFGLGFTTHSRLLEGLLLLLNGRTLLNRLALPAPASEEHVGETVSDGRSDGDGTRCGGHLG